ncbi:GntR family transcriptional regulator [Brevibacterium gallinarum]|uniref:GntR family transcriptional regulator n=1 Tax=Brevibacterium gallinarum TaxID=2762220 RepID=A0ABR8WY22_9MICO|nr:GntR family transcriptional regulator [Brevibacterium gallinarum]MBD8021894.1 GntR family transcriptional regulator [Brevibacterium gallinarum]
MKITARDRAAEWIRNSIVSGDLVGGEYIEESTVCEAVGVSRTPVREAFNKLAAERFITLVPRHGAQVRRVTAQELVDVYACRRLIESHAAELICEHRIPVTNTARDALAARLKAAEDAAVQPEDPALRIDATKCDWTLHREIVGAAGNLILVELYESLQWRHQRVSLVAAVHFKHLIETFDRQHRMLIEAWEELDEEKFKRTIHEHLRPISEILRSLPAES